MTKILISGASIGSPALAYWLGHHGFEVGVGDLAPSLRAGGQAVDVRGPALDVAERMGLLGEIRSLSTAMRGMTMVDGDGHELFRSTERMFTGGEIDSPDVEIMRDDLSRLLFDVAEAEYLFDDSITAIDGGLVSFERAAAREFDVIVGDLTLEDY